MNLERVQKYYELIDRELGLESDDDLFGFESDDDDLFGFESDDDDLFGFESGGAKRGFVSQMYSQLKNGGVKGLSSAVKSGNTVLGAAIKNGSLRKQIQYIMQMITKHIVDTNGILPFNSVIVPVGGMIRDKASAHTIAHTESMLLIIASLLANGSVNVSECKNAAIRLGQFDFVKANDSENKSVVYRQLIKICAPFIKIMRTASTVKLDNERVFRQITEQIKSSGVRKITDDIIQIFKCVYLFETKVISIRNAGILPKSEITNMLVKFSDCVRGMKLTCRYIRSKVGE